MKELKTLGVIVWYGYGGSGKYGWWAKADIDDFSHCEPQAVRGEIKTKYATDISSAISTVLMSLKSLSVELMTLSEAPNVGVPYLYYHQDGESTEYAPPDGWRKMLRVEAAKFGLHTYPEKPSDLFNDDAPPGAFETE